MVNGNHGILFFCDSAHCIVHCTVLTGILFNSHLIHLVGVDCYSVVYC